MNYPNLQLGALILVITSTTAFSAVITLQNPASIPVPSGSHLDGYWIPDSLLGQVNPITTLAIDYQNLPLGPGQHSILSTWFLFNSADVSDQQVLTSNPDLFQAVITFSEGVTGITNPYSFAFAAVHATSGGLTNITFTATYQDGSTRTASNGIIPEPSGGLLIATTGIIGLLKRDRKSRLV